MEEICFRVCFFFFMFSTQNQVPQVIIWMGGVIHQSEAGDSNYIQIVSTKTLIIEENWFKKFLFLNWI